MANPTFDSHALFTGGEQSRMGPIQVRAQFDQMPGLNGEFVQGFGTGGMTIRVRGQVFGTANASHATAFTNLRTAQGTVRGYADGTTVAAYVDTNGTSYDNCILMSFVATGPVYYKKSGANHQYWQWGEVVVRLLVP